MSKKQKGKRNTPDGPAVKAKAKAKAKAPAKPVAAPAAPALAPPSPSPSPSSPSPRARARAATPPPPTARAASIDPVPGERASASEPPPSSDLEAAVTRAPATLDSGAALALDAALVDAVMPEGSRARYDFDDDEITPPSAGVDSDSLPTLIPKGGNPSYEVGEETMSDIAPIGPTEFAGADLVQSAEGSYAEVGPSSASSAPQLEQQIRDLEARLDAMIAENRAYAAKPGSPVSGGAGAGAGAHALAGPFATRPGATAKEVLSGEYYQRQWGKSGMRSRAPEVDEFGHDPAYEARLLPLFDLIYKRYFRVEVEGVRNVPEGGRCLIVANHSGGPLPYDGLMLRTTLRREHPAARELRWLAEDFIYYLPFVGAAMNRLGAVRACQENAERLLAQGRLVAVFPEGVKGVGKLFRDRYRLQRFGRGGFIRLGLRTQTPIVPCAIVGAEEANPMLYRVEYMAKTLGIPYLPVTPTFPALGPVGLLPAPTKWKVRFGEPLHFDGVGPESADDEILVARLAERVRTTIQGMLDDMLSKRRSVWFG